MITPYFNQKKIIPKLQNDFPIDSSPPVLSFKVPLWSNSRCPLAFYIFIHNRSFLDVLANFNLLRTLELTFFWTFSSENLRSPLIFFVSSLSWELEKWTSFSQKYQTGWNYNNNYYSNPHKKITKTLAHIFVQFSTLIFIITDFNPCGIFEKMTSLLKFSTTTWNKEN